jgi:GntR family transcriptional regulator
MKKKSEVQGSEHTYQRLQGQVARLIAATQAGERLPAEPELAQQLGVSRATLREAMRSFEAQGLIRRRQGIGTFVVGHSQVIDSGLEVLESIETIAKRIQLDVAMGELSIDTLAADMPQAEALEIAEGTQVVRVARVIIAEKRPVAFLVDVLPMNILSPDDLKEGFTGSVLDWLLRRGAMHFTSSYAEIQAVAAPPEIARKLEIQRGDVLLMFTARLYSDSSKVVVYSQSYFLPGYFHFHVVRRVGTGSSN